jgi:flagellar motility protein MotE (MotC chaperone)
MVRILQSHGFAGLFGMVLYLAVTAWCWRPLLSAQSPETLHATLKARAPSWEFSNPELEQLVSELTREKAALAERAHHLDELAARLEAEKLELTTVTQTVHRLQRDLDETLVRVTDEETANLKKLARVYAAMSPEGAAGILKQLEQSSIVKIMLYMKEDETAPVLEALASLGDPESRLAADISERLRMAVFRKPPEKPRS